MTIDVICPAFMCSKTYAGQKVGKDPVFEVAVKNLFSCTYLQHVRALCGLCELRSGRPQALPLGGH
ncbi:hypothetical protein GW17_00042527 [Ensete ventricosum]|nr:hypothetical protein GW17_00042527 [Ensete ventricosum]